MFFFIQKRNEVFVSVPCFNKVYRKLRPYSKNLAILPITLTVCRLLLVLLAFNATGAVQLLLNSAFFFVHSRLYSKFHYVSFISDQRSTPQQIFSVVRRLASRHSRRQWRTTNKKKNALTHVGRTLTRALGEHTISNEKWYSSWSGNWNYALNTFDRCRFVDTNTHLWTFVVAIGHFKLVYDVSFARELNYLVIIYFVFEPTYSMQCAHVQFNAYAFFSPDSAHFAPHPFITVSPHIHFSAKKFD